jgi:hypothetical protein
MKPALAFLILLTLLGLAAPVHAVERRCFDGVDRWSYDREKEPLARPGERFLDDLKACDSTFHAAVVEAVRYRIHTEEAAKFTRSKSYVLAAYGVAWAVLAAAGVTLFLRQRRLADELGALEAKLREAEARGP